jgi:LuxR family transcriptional regulator, maltose regulon positive regulatory protein
VRRGAADDRFRAQIGGFERSNLNLVPLDRVRERYRYHHLFRDALRSELMRREPEAVPGLHRRAAAWLEGHGEAVAAVEHALAGDDLAHVERLIAPLVLALESTGRGATTRRWLDALGPETLERLPALALAAGWFAALGADHANAQRWLAIAERGVDEGFSALGAASPAAAVALLRGLMCPAGMQQMRADAELAVESEPAWSPWHLTALVAVGFSHVLAGDDVRGEEVLGDLVRESRRVKDATTSSVSMAQLALYALERGELNQADALSCEAHERASGAMLAAASAFALVARARVAQRRGDSRNLADYVAGVQLQRPKLTAAIPWLSALTLLRLTRVHIASGDSAGARTILRDLNDLLRERPDLGIVRDQAKRLAGQARALPATPAGATTLTPAELRLLPLLPRIFRSQRSASDCSFRVTRSRPKRSRSTTSSTCPRAERQSPARARDRAARRVRQRRTHVLEALVVTKAPCPGLAPAISCRQGDARGR